ncbi:hypothetical protein T265_02107 [Opisthorchis viverrini]|uniref:Uncharacterized protein n=1 Tax=Opisthorchis viverrini TaxID=6198 RepID=A0A075AIJ5_OPIVI|nr:hypothetical protein T265_02107 [Opisthorchis viverrini]KER31744.1 hypothetical protein T265_02107 [Opisthorchis viverrini]
MTQTIDVGTLFWKSNKSTTNYHDEPGLYTQTGRLSSQLTNHKPCTRGTLAQGVTLSVTGKEERGAAMADKPGPHEIGQEFGTLAGPTPRRELTGRQSGPNSQS